MADDTFDPAKELQAVRERRDMQRRRQYRKSKLDKFRSEIVALKKQGGSSQDISTWLRMKHRLKIHRSSVDRYLNGLPEITAAFKPVLIVEQLHPLTPFDGRTT